MPRFFVENVLGDRIIIDGENAKHITKSLRMKIGEKITLCDGNMMECECELVNFSAENVTVNVINRSVSEKEADVKVVLYQGVTKGDKMDSIIQKAVEVGVNSVVPIITSRCISRPDDKSARKKQERWQKISLEAAKQSQRGIIPDIKNIINFKQALQEDKSELKILFYEQGGVSLREYIKDNIKSISIFIGPEGGWDEQEVELSNKFGVKRATLGARILRTETAPIVALSAIMFATGNMD